MEVETTAEAYEELALVPICLKNPNHVGFHSMSELNVDILPEGWKTDKWVSYIRGLSKLVVRLTVKKDNGGIVYGSGYVFNYSDQDIFYVKTNHHVVGSQEEVKNCTIDFFYDTTDMKGIEVSCGQNSDFCSEEVDTSSFTFHPGENEEILQLMDESLVKPKTDLDNIIVISHPHGGPKKFTIGKYLSNISDGGVYKYNHTARTCPGSSGGVVIDRWSGRQTYWPLEYNHYIHCAGERRDVYLGKPVDTSNVNESVFSRF